MKIALVFLLIVFCTLILPGCLDRYPLVAFTVDVIEVDGICMKGNCQ